MEQIWVNLNGFSYHIPSGLPEVSIKVAYLFYEKGDIPIKLFQQKPANSISVLVLVGLCPDKKIISAAATLFSNARFKTALGMDLPARVLACRISLWLKGRDAGFWLIDTRVHFRYQSKTFSCPEKLFSLNGFCRVSGFRTNVSIYF
ncbi:hypothetical protein [Pedobacter aquatilis]|uniref:hypothetical protein n=1 Tax=Pedobacter aquatilis TaxID=351343 RepID=UPI00292E58CF|nr:hypothetical protein [Pedobacter aquatilis]